MRYAILSSDVILDPRIIPSTFKVLAYIAIACQSPMSWQEIAENTEQNPKGIMWHIHQLTQLEYLAEMKDRVVSKDDEGFRLDAMDWRRTYVILCGGSSS